MKKFFPNLLSVLNGGEESGSDEDIHDNNEQTVSRKSNKRKENKNSPHRPDKRSLKATTLPELFAKVVPAVHLAIPSVLVLGEQSSGKTRLIISLIFYYLIDHPLLSDEMGISLLKLFRTGQSMVTRRPTTVKLIHSVDESINITLLFQQRQYEFGTAEFMQLIEELSSSHPGELFEEEIVIQIVTNNVPDLVFTDYPGITTEDKVLCDSGEGKTLKGLIEEKVQQPYNTLVIVEPASREDFSTSHIYPLLQ
jgi:hypothetical protein